MREVREEDRGNEAGELESELGRPRAGGSGVERCCVYLLVGLGGWLVERLNVGFDTDTDNDDDEDS